MKRLLILIFCLAINTILLSHPWKPAHYVIIDTDGGIDDLKAITMLLSSPDVRVLAVTTSPGVLDSETAFVKVRSLLNAFYHEGIPVGINRESTFKSPVFPVAMNLLWGEEKGIGNSDMPDCIKVIGDILFVETSKISFICLGGMSTAYLAYTEIPEFRQNVKEIIWSANGLPDTDGFNYNTDKRSADKLIKGDIPVSVVKGSTEDFFYDLNAIEALSQVQTIYADKISSLFEKETVKEHKYVYQANDEMAVLFLHYPDLFSITESGINKECKPSDTEFLREGALKILAGETVARNQLINDFPFSPEFYFSDIEPSVSEIVKKYGKDEWISGVIASELHRHLGVFAIVGVKMGIRAREYFNTGVDEFSALSFAGSIPPLSCMNDGIQVSTGATPGHGLLAVNNDLPTLPSVEFTYMNRKIRLTLKPEIAEKISSELKEINYIYGLDSNIYWELVRKSTIKYWLSLDRHLIFDVEEVK